MPGRISQLLDREGDEVRQGQVLARLQGDQARARLDHVSDGVKM
jgi:multidrug resistance efflux pump